ncbi:DegV domain-containing protein [Oxobacter pfennigii]|uniref:DegV domain-containing protein n=1 Tax=Oxobacter pfennigii TaxID=36849 RepID=A0A0P8WDG4_9CLOT|nr:DegV family protein [Oxobacter pfennigii]KPU45964.1 DegV domain-containing protein [Oxobacter pfennigii]
MQTVILTDSCSDLPLSYVEENNIHVIGMAYNFKGQEHIDDFGKTLSYKEFYDNLRAGEMSSTSQINVFTFVEIFKKYVNESKSVLYIGFSSALSGSVNSAKIARETVMEEIPGADITVVDSLCASGGEGLLVYHAVEMLKKGHSKDEIADWAEKNKLKVIHWFTVEDLNHLKRGGRVSSTAAFVGTILDIKPILQVNDEGKLIPITKVKGRKKSIKALADKLKEMIVSPEEQVIFINHGDCLEEAEYLKRLVLEEVKVKDVVINYVGPVVGSHSGPGTLTAFFMGDKR